MPRSLPALLAGTLILTASPLASQGVDQPFSLEGSGQKFSRLQDAVNAIGEDTGTILVAPGTWRDCAVQGAGDVTYKAVEPGTAIFDRRACEDKAALVLRGRSASVDGLIFQNMKVPDANGAGIRLEKGNLTVRNTTFRESEQGILTAADPNGSILIERSTFSRLGRCDRGLSCAHSIYIGDYGALTVRKSRFEKGNGGHYVKSHAARIEVTDSTFDDVQGSTTNYMIDLPSGASGLIARNLFVQGENKENHSAFITVAPEGRKRDSSGLKIDDNDARIAPGINRTSAFVANWTGDAVQIGANKLGPGLTKLDER